jgi:hypothetical protein
VWATGESVRQCRAACLVDEGEGHSSTSHVWLMKVRAARQRRQRGLVGSWVVVGLLTRNPPFGATRRGSVGSRRAGPGNCGTFPRFWDFATGAASLGR